MSASYVRNMVRSWASAAAAAESVPFYDTINIVPEVLDPIWFTVIFQSERHIGTICTPEYVEYGFATLMFIAPAGTGDAGAIDAVERVLPQIMASADPTGRLVLEKYDPIVEETSGSADSSYRVFVTISYSYSQV